MMRSFTMLFILLCITACMVKCSGAWGAECKLEWAIPPLEEQVTKWQVFRGIDLIAETTDPKVTLDLPADSITTLSVRAVNIIGLSPAATITVIPFTPRHSEDLTTWEAHPSKVIFLEAKPRLFSSYSFPKP